MIRIERSARRSPGPRLLSSIASLGQIGGIVVLIWEGSSPLPPIARAGGALGFIAGTLLDLYLGDRSTGIGAIVGLSLAYNCTTRQHASAQPLWLTAFGIVILAALVGGAIPYAVVLWRRRSDERDRAIANGSMAFALLTTIVLLLVFSLLKDLRIGPHLQPDWALWTAASSWFAAWFYLRRSM